LLRNDSRIRYSNLARREDHFLDVAQPVFAEEDLVADEEGGRAEGAARDRALRIAEQPRLDWAEKVSAPDATMAPP
jgi:hypothetical protein